MSTLTALNGNRAFSADSSRRSIKNGKNTRTYWAATALYQAEPDGRYEIERVHSSRWEIRHHQVFEGGKLQVIRDIGFATTKGVAINYAEVDHSQLGVAVYNAITNGTGRITA